MSIIQAGPAQEDLNLAVNGTILLTPQEVAKLVPGQLFRVRIKVMDDDTFSDDVVHTDETFERGVCRYHPHAVRGGGDCAGRQAAQFRAGRRKYGRNLLSGGGRP